MEPFCCTNECRRGGTAKLIPERQAEWCCTLPGFDRRRWQPEGLVQIHLGAPPRYADGADDLEPEEPIEEDGCPGGWYRTAFVDSVLRYARRPTGEGGRVPNRLLDLTDDELVVEAVERLEAEEDRWQGEHQRRMMARIQARSQAGAD